MINKLIALNEDLVQQASKNTVRPAVPVHAQKPKLPVRPVQQWTKTESYMEKTFEFSDPSERNMFLFQILGVEEEKGHNADMDVKEKSVKVRLTTRDVNRVTELDREYSQAADSIYSELKSLNDAR